MIMTLYRLQGTITISIIRAQNLYRKNTIMIDSDPKMMKKVLYSGMTSFRSGVSVAMEPEDGCAKMTGQNETNSEPVI
jgi:hypothetical protein